MEKEKLDMVVAGKHFEDWDELEEFCFCFPEFEEEAIETGLLFDTELKRSVDTYYIVSELDYGDDNTEMPYKRVNGWFGDIILEIE